MPVIRMDSAKVRVSRVREGLTVIIHCSLQYSRSVHVDESGVFASTSRTHVLSAACVGPPVCVVKVDGREKMCAA